MTKKQTATSSRKPVSRKRGRPANPDVAKKRAAAKAATTERKAQRQAAIAERGKFTEAGMASRGRVSALYDGLSQSTTRHQNARPFALYAESAESGNGHAPKQQTERDYTAMLEAGNLTGYKLGVDYNPGTIPGDKSAHGIRAMGHGWITFNSDKSAFQLTQAGLDIAKRQRKLLADKQALVGKPASAAKQA